MVLMVLLWVLLIIILLINAVISSINSTISNAAVNGSNRFGCHLLTFLNVITVNLQFGMAMKQPS